MTAKKLCFDRISFIVIFWASLLLTRNLCGSYPNETEPIKKELHIVILAGPITGHPKNTHEYEKSATLIKHLLDVSGIQGIKTTVVFDGWPSDPQVLDSADTIVMISDGGDHKESNHPLYNGDRIKLLEKQMNRGCGLVQLHWSTFNPSRYHDKITEWVGGYFDYEKGTATNKWYSAIKHYTEPIRLGVPSHPISNGVKPFRVLEEFYYRIRFRDNDPRLKKIVLSKPTGETREFAVGWAVQRKDGGRGFGFTGGHYYMNWWDANFRKLILNAIVWTAGMDVPKKGVNSQLAEPTRALIVTGHNHPAHLWRKTTAALVQVIENDPRVLVDVTEDPKFLGSEKLREYDVVVMNYSSWDREGLSEKARKGFVDYLKAGGGLAVIHFANGSWTDTLPNKESDWPEYRTKIVRRVWVHGNGNSGHDAFGDFRVTKTSVQHPITDGLQDFPTRDELYYRQMGPLPIEPLVTAVSRDTKKTEPMAWAYSYEKAKVFQTVLGHADVSILMAGDLIRRGTSWAAGLKNLSFDPPVARKLPYLWRSGAKWSPKISETKVRKPEDNQPKKDPKPKTSLPKLVAGKFGKALNARDGGLLGKADRSFQEPNLTVECWVKINSKSAFNIICASETKSSLRHWELYTYAGTGYLSVYMPGIFGEIKSKKDICDGKWHYIAMTFEKQFVKLYVDGSLVKSQPINFRKHPESKEGFSIGSLVEKTINCDGAIDELRISNEIKAIDSTPSKPFEVEKSTIGLWRFDRLDAGKNVKDLSKKKNDLASSWKGIQGKKVASQQTGQPKKITGHWGEDAIGFRWTEKDSEDNRWAFTKHGRFLASTIPLPGGFAEKGLVVKVGKDADVSVCYDLKRLNLMAGWSGGFLEFSQARFGLIRHLKPVGTMLFHNLSGLGWNSDKLRYRGLYPNGDRVLLEYSVGDTLIQESPWLEKSGQASAIVRELSIQKNNTRFRVPICSMSGAKNGFETKAGATPVKGFIVGDQLVAVAVVADSKSHQVSLRNNQLWLDVGKSQQASLAKVLVWRGPKSQLNEFKKLVTQTRLADPNRFRKVGRKLWNETISTQGQTDEQSGLGYVVDTIRLPFKNPYGSLFFVTGHDWLSNGKMVVSTVHGEVWLAENVNLSLNKVTWKRFATGLYQPLGIRVVKDQIYVLCRDQIVRIHDRDGNDEADYYECFHPDVTTSTGVHDYVCCLETDQEGNFYYIHANDGVVRVSADGANKQIVATGFRNPNGMGVRTDGLVTAAPQEGEWTPASAVCEVIEGRHYGYRGPREKTTDSPLGYEKPLVFLPRLVDNSSGGQFWIDSDRWGVFQNRLFHLSYGKCTMHLVLRDELPPINDSGKGTSQGAVVPFPFVFESGVSRGRMNPHDGQLYVSGLKGWTTAGVRDGCIHRVRLVPSQIDKTFCPTSYKVFANGIELGFTQPLDPESIKSSSFKIEAWNYRYSKNYGSPEFKLTNPNQQGRDLWRVKSARLVDGNKRVFLEIPQIQVADQVSIGINVSSKSATFKNNIYATIKRKRTRSIKPGEPFDPALAKFEGDLTPGVFSRELNRSIANFAWSDDKSFGARTIAIATWLKLESPDTKLIFEPGSATSGAFRISTINDIGELKPLEIGKFKPGGRIEIPLATTAEYCHIDVMLFRNDKPVQFRALWKSWDFDLEPIPNQNLFIKEDWLLEPGSISNQSLQTEAAQSLLLENNCHRCHQVSAFDAIERDFRWKRTASDLINLKSRRSLEFVRRKILEPAFENHGGMMPTLFDASDPDELKRVEDLVAYLMEGQSADNSKPDIDNSKITDKEVEVGEKLFEQLGCVGCHHLPVEGEKDKYDRLSFKFTGEKFTTTGLRDFLLNPHRHSPYRKMGDFGLSKEEAKSLAGLIDKYSTAAIFSNTEPKFAKGNALRGKKVFDEVGCANCHQVSKTQGRPKFHALKDLESGCLDIDLKERSKNRPKFDLSAEQRKLLRSYLNEASKNRKLQMAMGLGSTPRFVLAEKAIKELRCYTCHNSEYGQAKLPEIVLDEGVFGLNPERLPDLTQIGNKLKTNWIEEFLKADNQSKDRPRLNTVRPWLRTRMPKFGSPFAKVIAHGLTESVGRDSRSVTAPEPVDKQLAEFGFHLTGQAKGLDCRQCHGVGDLPPRGDEKTQIVLGVNFSQVKNRLHREYYDRWMRDPLRIDPQTKMPKYSADGKSTKIREILDGDSSRQFDALWNYLKSVGK